MLMHAYAYAYIFEIHNGFMVNNGFYVVACLVTRQIHLLCLKSLIRDSRYMDCAISFLWVYRVGAVTNLRSVEHLKSEKT